MDKIAGVGCLVFVAACASTADKDDPSSKGLAVVARTGDTTTLVLLNDVNRTHVDEIVSGGTPSGFQWIAISIGDPWQQSLAEGVKLDMTSVDANTAFRQGYFGPCNPAENDFDACWLYESYSAGDVGLTGSIDLTFNDGFATGGVDISWTGLTDRFGSPTQSHTHETIAPISTPLQPQGPVQ